MKKAAYFSLILVSAFAITGCGGGGDSSPVTELCPTWNAGSTMAYDRTETISGVSTTTSSVYTVTEHSATTIALSNGVTLKTFTIVNGAYVPATEGDVGSVTPDTYSSTTPFCPPPAVGDSYLYSTFIAGPFPGTGEIVSVTLPVTSTSTESVVVPAGTFVAKKLVMAKSVNTQTPPITGTVTRYYVSGVGVVKEVEDTPSTQTVVTDELTAYTQ